MLIEIRWNLMIIVTMFLVSCAGTNFVKPDHRTISLNKTTYQEILSRFGKPRQEGSLVKNGKNITSIVYAYSSYGGAPLNPGVTPAKAMGFYFLDDLLIGYEYTCSYKEGNTDFDDSKVSFIKEGTTTRSEVVSHLGYTDGKYIFPLIDTEGEEAIVYMYSQFKNYKVYRKTLVISFADDVVTDVQYTTFGKK